MITVAATALALAATGEACFVNRTNERLAVVLWEQTDSGKIKLYRFDLASQATECLKVVSPKGRPFAANAGYSRERSEDPKLKAHCPLIASGETVRLVFAPVNDALACAREG
jgi:hypothetical protein